MYPVSSIPCVSEREREKERGKCTCTELAVAALFLAHFFAFSLYEKFFAFVTAGSTYTHISIILAFLVSLSLESLFFPFTLDYPYTWLFYVYTECDARVTKFFSSHLSLRRVRSFNSRLQEVFCCWLNF